MKVPTKKLEQEALALLVCLVNEFPGLANGDDEVSASDLVDAVTQGIDRSALLCAFLKGESK